MKAYPFCDRTQVSMAVRFPYYKSPCRRRNSPNSVWIHIQNINSNLILKRWLCTFDEVQLVGVSRSRFFRSSPPRVITDKLPCWHSETSSNLVAFHNIRLILSRSFFSRFKTTRYVFPMKVRIIKWFKIFLSPPPQNAFGSKLESSFPS